MVKLPRGYSFHDLATRLVYHQTGSDKPPHQEVFERRRQPGLMKRYGELERGTKKFIRRIPKNIDWRAIRLARSELYASIQESSRIQGHENPAIKTYVWNLTAGAVHECICPDLAANSPYRENEVPDYPHSNCLCYITYQIRSRNEFVTDLKNWGDGLIIPYIDTWYHSVYLPFNRGGLTI